MSKRCTKCKQDKPLSMFNKDKSRSDGLQSKCKECESAYAKQYRADNPDKERERNRKYYSDNHEAEKAKRGRYNEQHRDEAREYALRYRIENPEKTSQRHRTYYEANSEKIKAKTSDWQKKYPDKVRVQNNRRRARILSAGGTFTTADVRLALRSQKGKCWHCGEDVGKKYHIDHLTPLARGGSNAANNIVISCAVCNHSKGAKLCSEWNGKLL